METRKYPTKIVHMEAEQMYRKLSPQLTIDDFILPFSGKLSAENRWVQLAKIIPWDEIEKEYAFMFPSDRGNVAKPVRMALGSLLIQARCGYTDRETVQQITENPYLQYFIGLKEYQLTKPFTPVALVKFQKRFNAKRLAKINELIVAAEAAHQNAPKASGNKPDDHHDDQPPGSGRAPVATTTAVTSESSPNQGTLLVDATCTPADLHYPTDLRLLVRVKAGAAVEFGAKVAISLENGYSRIEKLSWDPFNEAATLPASAESYRERNGCYPEVILADRIYRNRANLSYCKACGIRISGPKLGRPQTKSCMLKAERLVERQDAKNRNAIEGKFCSGYLAEDIKQY